MLFLFTAMACLRIDISSLSLFLFRFSLFPINLLPFYTNAVAKSFINKSIESVENGLATTNENCPRCSLVADPGAVTHKNLPRQDWLLAWLQVSNQTPSVDSA